MAKPTQSGNQQRVIQTQPATGTVPIMPDKTIVISASVITENHLQAARAAEVLARAAAGLVLEGISIGISMAQMEDETDE